MILYIKQKSYRSMEIKKTALFSPIARYVLEILQRSLYTVDGKDEIF